MPKPYYQDEWVAIYHGDCRELLPQITADVILTDFPYGIGLDYGGFQDTTANLDDLISTALPMMRDQAPVVAFTCGIVNIWRYPVARWVLCWYQINGRTSTGYWGFNNWQPVLVYGTDPYLSAGMGRRPDVITTAAPTGGADKKHGHPCAKPIEAWRKVLVRVMPIEKTTVLDPFMGSGSTLVAAKYTGRRAIGIEIEERYCDMAARRCAQEVFDLAA